MRLQLDVATKECPFKYKIAIMLLHIHIFLLRAYHSMQSTLPYRHGSRGGGITATVGGGNSHVSSGLDQCNGAHETHGSLERANYGKMKETKMKLTSRGQVAENGNFALALIRSTLNRQLINQHI